MDEVADMSVAAQCPEDEGVVAGTTKEVVVAGTGDDRIVAGACVHRVMATAADDEVAVIGRKRLAGDGVGGIDQVMAGSRNEDGDAGGVQRRQDDIVAVAAVIADREQLAVDRESCALRHSSTSI